MVRNILNTRIQIKVILRHPMTVFDDTKSFKYSRINLKF